MLNVGRIGHQFRQADHGQKLIAPQRAPQSWALLRRPTGLSLHAVKGSSRRI
jgi:hypothetical protein